MDRSERFYKIDQMLSGRKVVPVGDFLSELDISLATFKRDLEYLRDRLNAPIVWDREAGGYRYESQPSAGPAFALPGMWFNASEAHALLLIQQLLKELHPGLLKQQVEPLQARLKALLGSHDHSAEEVEKRFRLIHAAKRVLPLEHFEVIASATLGRKQLRVLHFNRERDETLERQLSPQQIVFYRDNWYLDAWCHLRNGIRSFSIDAIRQAELTEQPAKELDADTLRAYFEKGYGIFSGNQVQWAKLRFTPGRARWVASEVWHPEQRFSYQPDGSYLLELPYADDRELLMDILRHGQEVEVLAPHSLRTRMIATLSAALKNYD
jgi:predicted DNA-binding transcriptional regulator YafY